MRLRSVVLPAVVALAGAVVAPSPAAAASAQCALVVPTKLVINAPVVRFNFNLTQSCVTNGADHAYWDLTHNSGAGGPMDFESADMTQRYFFMRWHDDAPMGNWYLRPDEAAQADGDPLTQNSAVTKIKYASQFSAVGRTRYATKLSLTSTVTQWSARAGKYVGRPNVPVALQFKPKGSTTWSYVKSARASSAGKVTISVASPRSGSYRLMVAETNTVWAAYSAAVAGR
jgi:hypothetical protein